MRVFSGIVLMLLMASMLNILLVRTPSVEASPSTVLSVFPTSTADPALGPGSIFCINITVTDVQQLAGFQFVLSYDTTVLTADDCGIFLPFDYLVWSEIDDVLGYVELAAIIWSGELTSFDPMPIAWIEFIVDDTGMSLLDLHGPSNGSLLGKPWGESIPHEDVDGFFDNRLQVVMAITDVDPSTLNLRSNGKWITAYTELPEDYNPADINASTILLNGTIAPILDPKYGFVTNSSEYLVDHDGDGVLERMVKFDRAALQSWIYQSVGMQHEVSLTITGELTDGTPFEGTHTIFAFWQGQKSPTKR